MYMQKKCCDPLIRTGIISLDPDPYQKLVLSNKNHWKLKISLLF